MIYDVAHLSLCLLAICMSYLVRYPFRSFGRSLIGLFIFLLLSWRLFTNEAGNVTHIKVENEWRKKISIY